MKIRVATPEGQVVTACFMVLRGRISQIACAEGSPLHADIRLSDADLIPLGEPKFIPRPAPQPVRGLGDVVAKALSAVGIRKKKGCNCGKRQDLLNRMIPFGGKK